MADSASPTKFRRLVLLAALPVLASVALYKAIDFDAADLPEGYSFQSIEVPTAAVAGMEKLGEGLLRGAEDLAYDAGEKVLYAGCMDGWIRRVRLDPEDHAVRVEDHAFVGGRPLGVALAPTGTLYVANADKGLMSVEKNGETMLLTDQADGLNFKITDGVDVSSDGTVYFTDGSSKYNLKDFMEDILELRPHGRVLSFDPQSNRTSVLVSNLYFANGLTLSPDENSIIYCETMMRRCMRYYINGHKRGAVDNFIHNLPGLPDNIRYSGQGSYWIGLAVGKSWQWDLLFKYSFLRKLLYAVSHLVNIHVLIKDGGVMEVSLDGQPRILYKIPAPYHPTGGLNIGKHLYISSLTDPYLGRVKLTN